MKAEPLMVYMVYPEGRYDLVTVVLAPSEEVAEAKYRDYISKISDLGECKVNVINLTADFATQGYEVYGYKSGMFH